MNRDERTGEPEADEPLSGQSGTESEHAKRDDLSPAEQPDENDDSLGGVTITGFDQPPQAESINDGWYDLPPGAEPFTPDQWIPDRTFNISDIIPDDLLLPEGDGYMKPGQPEDPDSPKAGERRRLVEQNKHIYGESPPEPPAD